MQFINTWQWYIFPNTQRLFKTSGVKTIIYPPNDNKDVKPVSKVVNLFPDPHKNGGQKLHKHLVSVHKL